MQLFLGGRGGKKQLPKYKQGVALVHFLPPSLLQIAFPPSFSLFMGYPGAVAETWWKNQSGSDGFGH